MATASTIKPSARSPFFPKADAAVLSLRQNGALPTRPQTIWPIYDPENLNRPVMQWTSEEEITYYPPKTDEFAPSIVPEQPAQCFADRYLRASLAKNERLRLSMLWYYTRDIQKEVEFLHGLQEKLLVAQEASSWEFVVIGVLDINVYIRLATIGLPLAILPRGETICAHTISQPPGSVFLMPNMMEDWRFRDSPYVESGGLVAYAGVPLRIHDEASDTTVSLGSLCVCSTRPQPPLTKSQQSTLTRVADWVISDIIQCARVRRQRQRQRMNQLLASVKEEIDVEVDGTTNEEPVLKILQTVYPDTVISLQPLSLGHIVVEGRDPLLQSDLEDGIWEDIDYLDDFIAKSNHLDFPGDRVVRLLSARCDSVSGPCLLIVASKDFRLVFDDVDSWFVQACAAICSQIWHKRLLMEAMRTKEKFLRGFSHQLRTPIHGILGSAELLAEELKSRQLHEEADRMAKLLRSITIQKPGEHSIYLDTIKSSGRDLISIVNNMITLNKWADVAMKNRSYAPYSIEQLENDLANELSKSIAGDARYRSSVLFRRDIPADHAGLQTEKALLRDSLLPLIVNAIQNTRDGVVMVTTSIRPERNELVVDVEDTGCGIHPDNQRRIFEPYEKIDTYSTGAGLGLTLASKFATLLHGSVTLVTSNPSGSHFRAAFHDMQSIYAPHPSQILTAKLVNLPARFYHKPVGPKCTSLCDFFTRFLTEQGFVPTSECTDCFVIADFVPDLEQFRTQLSQISPEQVVICPIPTIDSESPVETCNNIVYVRGPFLTSTLSSALEEADALVSKMKSLKARSTQLDALSSTLSHVDINGNTDLVVSTNMKELSKASCDDTFAYSDMVTVTLPAIHKELEQTIPVFPTRETSSRPTALLVDDNNINLRILQMYCKKRGLPYLCAQDGEQAVQLFSKQQSLSVKGEGDPIHLILMDLQMPVCNGIDATKQIRALERQNNWGRSVVFVVTGQDSLSDRADAKDAEADNFYVKPVAMKTLDSAVKRHFPLFETF